MSLSQFTMTVSALASTVIIGASAHAADVPVTETIVLMRHGEKPEAGLGQLDCQGLNRALALPAVLSKMFAKPDAIFASNPSQQKPDGGQSYDYVRPLATIEPSAVAFGLPVNTQFGFADVDGLAAALTVPRYAGATILVAWEHHQIVALAKNLLKTHGGNPDTVHPWPGSDFDSLYVLKITGTGNAATAALDYARQNLDGLPASCPK